MLNRQDLCRYAPELLDRQCRLSIKSGPKNKHIPNAFFTFPSRATPPPQVASYVLVHSIKATQEASCHAAKHPLSPGSLTPITPACSSAVTPSAPPSLPQAIQSKLKTATSPSALPQYETHEKSPIGFLPLCACQSPRRPNHQCRRHFNFI